MVCVPCFAIPAILIVFRVIIRPLVYRIWGYYMQEPALSCPLPQKKDRLNNKDNVANKSEEEDRTKDAVPVESSKQK